MSQSLPSDEMTLLIPNVGPAEFRICQAVLQIARCMKIATDADRATTMEALLAAYTILAHDFGAMPESVSQRLHLLAKQFPDLAAGYDLAEAKAGNDPARPS